MSPNAGEPIEILMVEDNPADVRLTQEAFEEARVKSHMNVVGDGAEAMAFLRREGRHADAPRPDLILLDLNMPGRDGREVLKEVKEDPRLKRIPVVVLTSSRAAEDIVKCYSLHANCFITKPVELDQFVSVIRTIDEFWLSVVRLPPDR